MRFSKRSRLLTRKRFDAAGEGMIFFRKKRRMYKSLRAGTYYDCEKKSSPWRKKRRTQEVIVMDKNSNQASNKAEKSNQKGMNRTEFAQEYSLDTGKADKANKVNKTNKTNK